VQRLLYVGERAIGALTFHPVVELPTRPAERESLDVQALAQDARRIVHGDVHVAVPEIYRVGSSAGGRRPKAIVLHDAATSTIRSGGVPSLPGEEPCILKFDGVGGDAPDGALGEPQFYNRVEAAYGDMARAAGVEMPRITVLESGPYRHLLIPRFDIRNGERLHQHTLGGMLHIDYNEPGSSSYEEYFRTILRLDMSYDSLREAFRRMVFNVVAVNQDDHVKNCSFHMDAAGSWSLTPAYDITFARGTGFTATHQMRVRDKVASIRASDLLAIAAEFGIKRPQHVLERTRAVIADWESHAATHEVPGGTVAAIRAALDERAAELAG
jgi:serine/threonine-protein kinase HipA